MFLMCNLKLVKSLYQIIPCTYLQDVDVCMHLQAHAHCCAIHLKAVPQPK